MFSIAAIDPGLDGAIAILRDDNHLFCYNMPTFEVAKHPSGKRRTIDEAGLILVLRNRIRLRMVFVEQVSAAPVQRGADGKPRRQGTASMFNFGEGFGIIKGITAALEIPRMFIPSPLWKRYFRLSKGDKEASRKRAGEIYPQYADQWTMVSGQINREQAGGRAEAALLAIYGRLRMEGKI